MKASPSLSTSKLKLKVDDLIMNYYSIRTNFASNAKEVDRLTKDTFSILIGATVHPYCSILFLSPVW
jgi:hypothetical protein